MSSKQTDSRYGDLSPATKRWIYDQLNKKIRILNATSKASSAEEFMKILKEQSAKEYRGNK